MHLVFGLLCGVVGADAVGFEPACHAFFLRLCCLFTGNPTPGKYRGKRVPAPVLLAIPAGMGYHAPHQSARGAVRPNPQPMTTDLNTTRIYVDADACPVKDEIFRVAARHGLAVSVVAGQFIRIPQDPLIERIAAGPKMDAADDWIAERAGKGDIVVTSDIPLASRCVKAGAEVIAPNGKPFTEQSIGMTLAVRNLMTDLRSSGEVTGGPRSFAARDRSAFLSALDQTIRRIQRMRANLSAVKQV
jgi:uncharacterized protein